MEIPANVKNRVGYKFGRLTVVEFVGFKQYTTQRQSLWKCLCECGSVKFCTAANIMSGTIKSCGCWNRERSSEHAKTFLRKVNTKHGLSYHPLYDAWDAMIGRCYNPEDKDYANYGGRGIKVCDRWRDVRNYVTDLVQRPDGMTLDRIDVDGDYSPENCKWSLFREQNLNTRFNLDVPNVYLDGISWKAIFQWRGERHYVGMFPTKELATVALECKLREVGWYDR